MRIFILAALISASPTPAFAAERRFSVADFDKIQVDGPFQVTVTTGGPSRVTAAGTSAALERVSAEVQNRTLRIRSNATVWSANKNEGGLAVLTVTTRQLQGAALNGSGSIAIDKAGGLKTMISVVGSGRASVQAVESDSLSLGLSGSGSIIIGGKAKTMHARVQGASSLDAAALTADDAQIVSDSAGSVKVSARRSANIQSNGVGDVEVSGRPACTVKNSGAGQVLCGAR